MTKTDFIGNISLIIESPYSPELAKKLLTAFTTDSLVLNYSIGFKLSEKQKSQLMIKNNKNKTILFLLFTFCYLFQFPI